MKNMTLLSRACIALVATTTPLGLSAVSTAPANASFAAPTAEASTMAADMTINGQCRANGSWSFNVTLYAASDSQYAVTYNWRETNSSGGEGSFGWPSMGNIATGTYGIGTSNTISQPADAGTSSVTISVRVAGIEDSATFPCRD